MAHTPKTINVTATVDVDVILGALCGRVVNPDTWDQVAKEIGRCDHDFDMSDTSERLDVVQIVCEALARTLAKANTQ